MLSRTCAAGAGSCRLVSLLKRSFGTLAEVLMTELCWDVLAYLVTMLPPLRSNGVPGVRLNNS